MVIKYNLMAIKKDLLLQVFFYDDFFKPTIQLLRLSKYL